MRKLLMGSHKFWMNCLKGSIWHPWRDTGILKKQDLCVYVQKTKVSFLGNESKRGYFKRKNHIVMCIIGSGQNFDEGMCCAVLSHSVMSNSLQPHGLLPSRLLWPWGFSRQEYWSRLPCPPPGDLPWREGIEFRFPALQADSLPSEGISIAKYGRNL